MSLKDIFCQDKALSILGKAFVNQRQAHAYIFAGLEGVGKFKTASEYAKLLLCAEPIIEANSADSCGSCKFCKMFEAGSHPDFNFIYKELREFTKDGKNKAAPVDMPIDVIREFVIAKVPQKPTFSARKVFVINESEKLNNASQNALLKILEEPPLFCTIILICTRLEKLLPTTKSRCQAISFAPIDEQIIMDKLLETGLDKNKSQFFSRLCQGSLGQACRWAQLELAEGKFYEIKKEILNNLADYDYSQSLDLAAKFSEYSKSIAAAMVKLDEKTSKTDINRKAAKAIVAIVISALYDAMRLAVSDERPLINFDQPGEIEKLCTRLDCEQAAEKITDCYTTMRWIDSSVNEKLIFEQLLLNLAVSDRMMV